MHPTLIKANIALLEGLPAEAQRLLDEYRAEAAPHPDPDLPLTLWLEAHTQPTPEAVTEGLRMLVSRVPPEDKYARMAQAYLQDEAAYTAPLPPAIRRQPLLLAGGFTLVGVLITIALIALFNRSQPPPTVDSTAMTQTAVVPTVVVAADLPDTSQTLTTEGYTARYPQGILNVLALENESRRVVRNSDGSLATPIAGARFYALELTFECRSGICDQPPQARISVILDDGTGIEPRSGLSISGETTLEAVALGRVTSGWVVFEIPLVSTVQTLLVAPRIAGEFEPITIALSG
ncbi:MAG: hypothetical protein IT321_30105 [Anaerolineae bacterium]|nr:hypothetical protein [Anaerolineae bacterium]